MTTAARPSVPAFSIARGIGFALAALLVELALPLVTSRSGETTGIEPISPLPYLSGALLRLAVGVLVFSALAWLVAETRSRIARTAAVVASATLLFLEAGSYRWLGEHGELLSFRSSFLPMQAYLGRNALIAATAAAVATLVALGIGALLEPVLERRYAKDRAVAVDLLLLTVAALFGSTTLWLGSGSLRLGATPPMVAWFETVERAPEEVVDEIDGPEFDPSGVQLPPPDVLNVVAATQQLRHLEELTDPAHPYCRPERPIGRAEDARSVVLLVLRGVPADAMTGEHPALPTLARLAAEGASFENVVSGGDDPTQGLVQILTGISPLAPARYHELANVPRLPSLPATLQQLGLSTAYVSSFDLSAGRERTLVRDLRFGSIDEPSFAAEAARGATDGSDAATMTSLIARLEATVDGGPRFVVAPLRAGLALGGVATPEPIDAGVVSPDGGGPDGATPTPPTETPHAQLEAQLARFVAWFDANERARGTVLIVTSDSAPAAQTTDESQTITRLRFRVPLVFANLRPEERNRGRARSESLVGLLDVADTILGIEGLGATGCFQGRDLLAARESPSRRRRLLAFGGPDQSFVFVFDGRFRWQIDRSLLDGPFRVYDEVDDTAYQNDLFDAQDPAVPFVRDQILAMLGVGQYLAANDRFLPGSRGDGGRPPVTATTTVQLASLADASVAATTGSLTARKAAGFGAFVLSVGFDEATLDPVASGKPLVEVLAALARPLGSFELALDVAMTEQASPARSVEAARRLALALDASGITSTIRLLPRDPIMAMSLAARTSRPVFVRIPGSDADMVALADGFGASGVVASVDAIAPEFVERAHLRGLRVLVDGVASLESLERFAAAAPDFVVVTTNTPIRPR